MSRKLDAGTQFSAPLLLTGHVLHHRLAAIAEAGSLHRRHAERAAAFVHDYRRQGLAFSGCGDEHARVAHAGELVEDGPEVLQAPDVRLVDPHIRRFPPRGPPLGGGHAGRRPRATVARPALPVVPACRARHVPGPDRPEQVRLAWGALHAHAGLFRALIIWPDRGSAALKRGVDNHSGR